MVAKINHAERSDGEHQSIQMTRVTSRIESLISYSARDWVVTKDEQAAVATLLSSDTNLDATIADLEKAGNLETMLVRLSNPEVCRKVVEILASRLFAQSDVTRRRYESASPRNPSLSSRSSWYRGTALQIFDICRNLGHSGRRHGFLPAAASCASPASITVSSNLSAPYTGSGATGRNATSQSIPLIDQAAMAAGHGPTLERYKNPIRYLSTYLSGLTPSQRLNQAKHLVCQPVSTIFPNAYGRFPPARAQVFRAAGRAHRLEPALVAAFVLAEQRDQSSREDAAEYLGAISILERDSSIGLGQVLISTADRHDLFADLLAAPTRASVGHHLTAALLASDEFNIFAVARYIRYVADLAAAKSIAAIPQIQRAFPAISLSAYAQHSSLWPTDNVKALASEYTSEPWDHKVSTGWAWFVHEGFLTIRSSGIPF